MKHYYTPLFLFLLILSFSSCKQKFDKEGRLLVEHLKSDGPLSFKPMMRSDSASAKEFKPDVYYFDGTPFTGAVAHYSPKGNIEFTGFLKNGLADSTWKFYYATGGLRIQGNYVNGLDVGLWRSYYGYNKPKIDKYYDDHGYMLMRVEYFDNGQIKNYQNIKCELFGNKERSYEYTRRGETLNMYVEDSVLILKNGTETERIGENIFVKKGSSKMEVVK